MNKGYAFDLASGRDEAIMFRAQMEGDRLVVLCDGKKFACDAGMTLEQLKKAIDPIRLSLPEALSMGIKQEPVHMQLPDPPVSKTLLGLCMKVVG